MPKKIKTRNLLLEKGYFPEVLPPCFDSQDLTRCFKGIITEIEHRKFHNRASSYIRYSGTKHDGNRRSYGTVNPIPYFMACSFISNKWHSFIKKFCESRFNISDLRLGNEKEDRAIVVPALSELTTDISSQLRYSPVILKADISQFFPSIYTHTISWVAHGVEASKNDQRHNSTKNYFNQLDWFTQQCQKKQTRGVVVGPDVFRVVAEYIICEIDRQLQERAENIIIGGFRHVDDFYIGVRDEIDAKVVLSHLRDILQNYELQVNDNKTKIICGLDGVDDVWAQELRSIHLYSNYNYALDKAHEVAKSINSQSPVKLILRRFDVSGCYSSPSWESIEQTLQRVIFHYGHCTDYICLLLVKRFAIQQPIDKNGWAEAIALSLKKHIVFNHHHETIWLLWVAFICKLPLAEELIDLLSKVNNSHIKALIIAAFKNKYLLKKPTISLGSKLSTTDENWLHNLVGRALGYSNAKFSGDFTYEFEYLAQKNVNLIDFEKHVSLVAEANTAAISSTKYGYDAEDEEFSAFNSLDNYDDDDDDDDDDRDLLNIFEDDDALEN